MDKTKQRIFLSSPHMCGLEKKYIEEAFDTNWVAPLGPHVDAFEKEIAQYAGIAGAVALSSATAAIHIALRLIGVKPGDRVFCSSLTFIGSVNPVLYMGAEPVFIDCEPESWNMSPQALKDAFQKAYSNGEMPSAAIVVNLYGQSADMDSILQTCREYNVPVIEDAAESLGATYHGKASGTFGLYGIYSLNGNKIITTGGGGMLVSEDIEALKKARFWATQARDPLPWYEHSEMGFNYRLSNILAAIGRGQLTVLDERVNARRAIFDTYRQALNNITGISFMPEAAWGRSNRWLTVMTIDPAICDKKPQDIIELLEKQNIETRRIWKPMHLQPIFAQCNYFKHQDKSVSDLLFEQGLCLPSGSNMTIKDQERVIDALLPCFNSPES